MKLEKYGFWIDVAIVALFVIFGCTDMAFAVDFSEPTGFLKEIRLGANDLLIEILIILGFAATIYGGKSSNWTPLYAVIIATVLFVIIPEIIEALLANRS